MTIDMLTRPATAPSGSGDEVDHLYCCDRNLAMCGMDLSQVPETEITRLCRYCDYIETENLPCPSPGCPQGAD